MDKYFYHYLYTEKNVPDMLDGYCAPMLRSFNPLIRMKARRLLNYWALLTDKAFFDKRIQQVFFKLYKEIDNNFPDLTYELSGRIKGLISTLNKVEEIEDAVMNDIRAEFIESCLNELKPKTDAEKEQCVQTLTIALEAEGHNSTKEKFAEFFEHYHFEENPFNRIRDFFAFRIVLEDRGTGDLIDELYKIANLTIEFFNSNTFEVCKSYPLIQTGELVFNSPIIHIPPKSGIKPEYKNLVKDYVICPKKDGYQSIHFVVYDPYTERYFEVQIRTRSMDMISETLANHDIYKKSKYGKRLKEVEEKIDYSQINVKGFRYFQYADPITGEKKEYISDRAGITQAIPIKLEFEHFLIM
ncbi:MAG: hypothetical protein IJ629_05645 [Clostridia bacterium]|nr:hypothetical protein [Clostridia bacterium]